MSRLDFDFAAFCKISEKKSNFFAVKSAIVAGNEFDLICRSSKRQKRHLSSI